MGLIEIVYRLGQIYGHTRSIIVHAKVVYNLLNITGYIDDMADLDL